MMKKLIAFMTVIFLTACSSSFTTLPADFSAVIISDLHLQTSGAAENPYVPLSARTEEVLKTAVEEVSDRKPDVLILCGDNTNSGNVRDLQLLHDTLLPLKQQGILIVQVPGNHDFNLNDETVYRQYTDDLIEPDERDEASLSYMKIAGNDTGHASFMALGQLHHSAAVR